MDVRKASATLARQIESAKILADFQRNRTDGIAAAVLRSLRVSYLALSAGLDPLKDANHLFTLHVTRRGDYSLTQGGDPVPVNAPYLAYLFWTAGVDLMPGQVLFLEPELAKDAIEEALGLLALEQASTERERLHRRAEPAALNLLWDRKVELVAASLLAEEYIERSRSLAGPEEAA
jgi:hypothetical protein